ncbi:MAG: argininosuccinate lyase, partial [Oleiharenicola lentus]
FRAAHHAVGAVVRLAEQRGVALDQIAFADVKQIHPAFGRDWVQSFDLAKAMARRTGTGMPGPAQVARQFRRWQKILGSS